MEWMQNNWKPIVILISMSLPILVWPTIYFINEKIKKRRKK